MKIFAVEPDEAYVRIFQKYCEKQGWKLHVAMNHVEALFLFAEERPFDYYYINLHFPYDHETDTLDYSGPDLIHLIKKYEMYPRIIALNNQLVLSPSKNNTLSQPTCRKSVPNHEVVPPRGIPVMSASGWYELLMKGF